jgi:hypothetical protein
VHDTFAEGDKVVQNRAEIRDQHGRRVLLMNDTVDDKVKLKSFVAQHRLEAADNVRHETEAFLEPCWGFPHRGRIEADSYADCEPAAIAEHAEVESREVAVQEKRNRASGVQRNVERPRHHIARPAGEDSNRYNVVGQRTQHLHQRTVAAQCKNGVVIVCVGFREDRGVPGGFRRHRIEACTSIGKGSFRSAAKARATARSGVHDQKNALDALRPGAGGHSMLGAGIEPAWDLIPRDFKSLASTNFATRATNSLATIGCALPTEPFPRRRKATNGNPRQQATRSARGDTGTPSILSFALQRHRDGESFACHRPFTDLSPMRRRSGGFFIFALALSTLGAPTTVTAQRVAGLGDDAIMVPRGVIRIGVLGDWTWFNQSFGVDGVPQPLGAPFTLDTLGVAQLPSLLLPVQSALRPLTGLPDWNPTLGNSALNLRGRIATFPITIEAGLSSRLSVSVNAPYVETETSPFFNVNTAGTEGNVGFNPALTNKAAAAEDAAIFAQFDASATALDQKLRDCAANPSAPGCAELNAQRASAQTLVDNSRAFATGMNGFYASSPFVPVTGTDAQNAIEGRVAAFKAMYAQFVALGVPQISANGPFAAQNRLTVADAQRLITDPGFGIGADSLTTVTRSHFGDIDIGGRLLLFDSFGGNATARMSPHGLNFRTAIGGIFRIPTSQVESPDNFIDIGTGRGAKAVEGRWFSDLLIGSHFWESFVVRINKPFADDQAVRITDLPNEVFPSQFRRQIVHRALGTTMEFETSPRLVLNNFFSLGGQYVYRHKAQDHYAGTFTVPAAVTGFSDVTLDASTLDAFTETKEQRIGGGLSYSNLYAVNQGSATIPFELTYLHWQTLSGSGGNVPKFFSDQVQLRIYYRLFGRKTAKPGS